MFGILFDVTRCKGCERCVDACVEANGLDPVAAAQDRATTRDGLSANRPLSLMPVDDGRFARMSCMHCVEPSCVSACLVGAIRKTPEGPVVYDPDMCIGCRYCMLACPFHVPRYEWQETTPFVKKCSMCFDRLRDGGQPACVEACPEQAIAVVDDTRTIQWHKCSHLLKCAEVCPSGAIEAAGKNMTVAEVMDTVERDASFYRRTGGGMTLSGGEPLVQWQFALRLLQEAKRRGLHTALDTTGCCDWEILEAVLKFTDLVLYDV